MLLETEDIRRMNFSVITKVWLHPGGGIARAELASSTGNRQTDELLVSAISRTRALAEAPPPDMPQPIRLRISSRL